VGKRSPIIYFELEDYKEEDMPEQERAVRDFMFYLAAQETSLEPCGLQQCS